MPADGKLTLLGYTIGADLSGKTVEELSVCEIAEKIRNKILCQIADISLDPDKAIEIDGEKWDPVALIRELKSLYRWTYEICGRDEGPAAVSSIPAGCFPRCNETYSSS